MKRKKEIYLKQKFIENESNVFIYTQNEKKKNNKLYILKKENKKKYKFKMKNLYIIFSDNELFNGTKNLFKNTN